MIRNIFRICCAGALVSAAASCTFDETANIKLVELGTPLEDNVCVIEAEGGEYELDIYSNGSYHVEVLAESDWLTLSALEGNGDGTIRLTTTSNDEFKRMTSFVLCSDVDSRRDTVYVKQKGKIEAQLSMDNTSMVVAGAGGQSTAVGFVQFQSFFRPFQSFFIFALCHIGSGQAAQSIQTGRIQIQGKFVGIDGLLQLAQTLMCRADGHGQGGGGMDDDSLVILPDSIIIFVEGKQAHCGEHCHCVSVGILRAEVLQLFQLVQGCLGHISGIVIHSGIEDLPGLLVGGEGILGEVAQRAAHIFHRSDGCAALRPQKGHQDHNTAGDGNKGDGIDGTGEEEIVCDQRKDKKQQQGNQKKDGLLHRNTPLD